MKRGQNAFIWRRVKVCLLITAILFISGCGKSPVSTASTEILPVKLLFATDLHFYAPELVGDFAQFEKEWEYGDGRVAQYSSEVVEALIDKTLREKPDALLLGGDLTLNGEYESHRVLADMLKPVRDAGIPVLVVPGNHDVNQLNAYSYVDQDSCATIDEKGFIELYSKLGIDGAKSRDKDSMSYMYAVSKDVYILMLDSCEYDGFGRNSGSISDKTEKWIEKQLKDAQKAGATVISASHHNLLQHAALWKDPFVMTDSDTLVSLLERYGVKLNLTGHMHIQHIMQSEIADSLSEAATGSLLVSPNYYGSVEVDAARNIHYLAESLDVSGWASENGNTDANLLDFSTYSQNFFDTATRTRLTENLDMYNLSGEEKLQTIQFAEQINRLYFAGMHNTVRDELLEHPGYTLWQTKCEQEFFATYIKCILEDKSLNHTSISIHNKRGSVL